MSNTVLQGYEDASSDLIDKFEAISSAELFAPVRHIFPQRPSRVLDIGAGTGRDAAWFASLNHTVVAVEPVAAFREAGIAWHKAPNIKWISDTLPYLSKMVSRGEKFDCIIMSAVWQHLEDTERQKAFSALRKLSSEGGKIVMSIRHGAGAPARQVFPACVSDMQLWAEQNGFVMVFKASSQSAQRENRHAGVTWTWLVLQAQD